MAEPVDPRPVENFQRAVQTQLPGIGNELQMAINTLKKLQTITGSLVAEGEAPPFQLDLRAEATAATFDLTGGPQGGATLDTPPQPVRLPTSEQVRVLTAGESFGRYQITRQLGQGAMGAVYLAYDPQLQRYVALKTPFLGDNPQVVQRFFREARSAAQVRSPYVCPIYEVDNVAGILYLSMAFIEGHSLAKWIHEEGPHALDEIVSLFRKIASGLQKAHAHEIIHRDLKPENIMVDTDGEPIIMDFGLARRVNDDIQVTAAGGLLGTPAYMSPEQVRGDQEEIGPQSDLYSLGVVLYEMLTGTVPFQGSIMTVLHKVINEQPAPPSACQPNLPCDSPIERICLKMMAKSKSDRYSCMTEVLTAVDHMWGPKPAAPPPPKPSLLKSMWKKSGKIFSSLAGQSPVTPSMEAPAIAPSTDHSGAALATAALVTIELRADDEPTAEDPSAAQVAWPSDAAHANGPLTSDPSSADPISADAIGATIASNS